MNQGLATLSFFGVGVNLVLFLTRVLQQDNASAANNVSKWTGTVYIFSLVGAFLSDSYWGRFKTCAIFQLILVLVSKPASELFASTFTDLVFTWRSGFNRVFVICIIYDLITGSGSIVIGNTPLFAQT